jgi:cytoskeleton protein RodZ
VPESDTDKGAGLPVGEYLKSVREARGVTLDEATRVTKISKNYLVAIEQGEFERLPNAAYIKGFLRLYANFLSLNADEVVNRYQSSLPAAPPVTRPEPKETERSSVELVQKTQTKGHRRWAIPLLLLALVGVAALFFTDSDEPGTAPAPAPQATPAPVPAAAPVAAPVQPQATSAAKAPLPAQKGEAANQGLPPAVRQPGGIILRLRFNRDTWLGITIDDSISQRYELKAGDVIEWKGTRVFDVEVGDGGAVEGELNGRPLKTLGEPGKPAHVELKEGQ